MPEKGDPGVVFHFVYSDAVVRKIKESASNDQKIQQSKNQDQNLDQDEDQNTSKETPPTQPSSKKEVKDTVVDMDIEIPGLRDIYEDLVAKGVDPLNLQVLTGSTMDYDSGVTDNKPQSGKTRRKGQTSNKKGK